MSHIFLYTYERARMCVCVCVYMTNGCVYIPSCLAGQTWKWIPLPLSISSRFHRLEHLYNARNAHALFYVHTNFVYIWSLRRKLYSLLFLFFEHPNQLSPTKSDGMRKRRERDSERRFTDLFIYLFTSWMNKLNAPFQCLDSIFSSYLISRNHRLSSKMKKKKSINEYCHESPTPV